MESDFKPPILVKRKVLVEDCCRKGIYHEVVETIKVRDNKDIPKVLSGKEQI